MSSKSDNKQIPNAQIDQIKNILFGEETQKYNKKIIDIESQIKESNKAQDKVLNEKFSDVSKKLESANKEMSAQIKSLESRIGDKLKQQIKNLESIESTLNSKIDLIQLSLESEYSDTETLKKAIKLIIEKL